MNIWALDKNISIKHLLLLLQTSLEGYSYTILHQSYMHPQAVRLATIAEPVTTFYLYTYGLEPETYGLHIEFPDNGQAVDKRMEIYDSISFGSLVEILKVYFTPDRFEN